MTDEQFQEFVMTALKDLKAGQDRVESGLQSVKATQTEFGSSLQGVKTSQIRMENELGQKVTALFDAREVQEEYNNRIFVTLERLEAKIDVLQMETAHIRRVK
ncbi:hypothetical protein CEB3_c18030 [Peptococcaceae bacterium CEB3]|nr:hypothetical protein CEB3_c18030 [Peptococcaceae bacterium CEB3]